MASEQAAERKAALLLHSLPEAARQEVLVRLDAGRRDVLLSMLAELQSLGIPPGHAWIDLSQRQDESRQRQLLWNIGSAQAAAVLSGQSLETVAAALNLASWPWAGELLAQWPADQRARLASLVQSPCALPTPVAESLLASLADKVAQLGLTPDPSSTHQRQPRPSWLRRTLGKSFS